MNYKTLFIVDPVRSERIQLCKFIKEEFFTVMSFVSVLDCFKKNNQLNCDMIMFVVRKAKNEIKHLYNIKKKHKSIPLLLILTPDSPDVNLAELEEQGFTRLFKANNQDKIKEVTIGLLAPDGIPPRTETPHPVPIPEKYKGLLESIQK